MPTATPRQSPPSPERSRPRLRPDTRVVDLARSPLLDDLNHNALVVYIRLVAASAKQGRRVRVRNRDLLVDQRGAIRAIRELERAKLVRTSIAMTEHGTERTVELV
jgi:hypothetical protein